MGSRVRTRVGHKVGLQAGTPVDPQSSITDGFNSTTVPQPFIPEHQKCWTCINKFGSETIV